jgi:transposase InsO family protein
MLQRAKLVALHTEGLHTVAELAAQAGVSRKTAYKWIERYRSGGSDALADRSHARHNQVARTPPEIEALLCDCRKAHPYWGPRKLLLYLAKRHPHLTLPAPSTASAILSRHGLVAPRRSSARTTHPGTAPLVAETPGEIWTVDFKGQFKTGDGIYCYPLTVCDAYSRMILCCDAFSSVAHPGPLASFERLFQAHGLPRAIRSDNGEPFVSPQAITGLSRLNVLWTRLGITHQRIAPGRPDQNGQHERMHRTLKAETTRPPATDIVAQQQRFDAWRAEFNHERPHEALGGQVPSERYRRSERPMPSMLPAPSYPGYAEVRRVSGSGGICFRGHEVFISEVLCREYVALTEVGDGLWSVHFYDRLLGRLDERAYRLRG